MPKRFVRITCIVLAALLLLGLLSTVIGSRAYAVTQAEIDALQAQRDEIASKQADLQEQIDALEAEIDTVMEKKAALDSQIALIMDDIRVLDQQIDLYDDLIAEKAVEVEAAIQAEEDQFARYCARVRAMEETNKWSYVAFVFESEGLVDFLGRLNDVMDIVNNDRHVKDEYIAAREHVEQVKAEYEAVQAQQQQKREELADQESELEVQLELSAQLLISLQEDVEAYGELMDKIEADKEAVQAEIDKKTKELQDQKAREEAERLRQQALRQQQQAAAAAANNGTTTSFGRDPLAGTNVTGYYAWPVNATYITSVFGPRTHPITGQYKNHSGTDIAASYGSAIYAAASGTVTVAGGNDPYGYGNYVVIYHPNGTTSLYAHMSSVAVKEGQTVSQGQVIGYVGSTGASTGPHLHFEIAANGTRVDALQFFNINFTYSPNA